MEKHKTCSFFGHRRILKTREVEEKLKIEIVRLIDMGVKRFLVGTHGEFDNLALSTLRALRNTYKDIDICVVFTSLYSFKKDKYGISKADNYIDVETIMYDIEEEYYKRQITKANQCMIDDSEYVICYVNPDEFQSGAKQAMKYALKTKKELLNIFSKFKVEY